MSNILLTVKKPPRNVSNENNSSMFLPECWTLEIKTRQNGKSRGKTDKYYISPTGHTFRSQVKMIAEVEREGDDCTLLWTRWLIDGTQVSRCDGTYIDKKGQKIMRPESPVY